MDRLGKLLGKVDESARLRLWSDVKTVLVQHSLQLLLHGLRTVALPSASQVHRRCRSFADSLNARWFHMQAASNKCAAALAFAFAISC